MGFGNASARWLTCWEDGLVLSRAVGLTHENSDRGVLLTLCRPLTGDGRCRHRAGRVCPNRGLPTNQAYSQF